MIKVKIRNNTQQKETVVSEDKVIRDVLDENEFDTTYGSISLNGVPLNNNEVNDTFAKFYQGSTVPDTVTLSVLIKACNA